MLGQEVVMVHGTLVALLVALGTAIGILVLLVTYRSTLANREDDQIFLDPAERSLANEQRAIVKRMQQIGRPITALFIFSGSLLVAIAGLWLWQGLRNF
jgi:hypothetical protein